MARRPVVTRVIKSTKANVLVLDAKDREVYEATLILPRTYKDVNDAMNYIAKHKKEAIEHSIVVNDDDIIVSVLSVEEVQQRYIMSETTFMAYAEQVELVNE